MHDRRSDSKIIEVETDISQGLPSFSIVGLGDASVQEAKERVRSALKTVRTQFPPLRKTVNLAPAHSKHGPRSICQSRFPFSGIKSNSKTRASRIAFWVSLGFPADSAGSKGFCRSWRTRRKTVSKVYLPTENAEEGSFVSGSSCRFPSWPSL